jgi:hypothetical protein
MEPVRTYNGKPVEEKAAPAAAASSPAPAASTTHAEACGNVGETGEHGDLGSNAKS